MKTRTQLRTSSISLSLVILALGFWALGFAPFLHQQPESSSIFSVEQTYSLVGSTFSVLVGAVFLVGAFAFRGMRTGPEALVARINANLI
jgi:hypothetical protein